MTALLLVFLAHLVTLCFADDVSMPSPFTRVLEVSSPLLTGNDVLIAQTLLIRDTTVDSYLVCDGVYGEDSAAATAAFQATYSLPSTGTLDSTSAQLLIDLHSDDGYHDSGFTAASMGYLYKIHVPVHNNRSIESVATLYDAENNVLMHFKARTHGRRDDGASYPWPDFGNGDVGLNQFTTNGATITGLIEVDLNSPEPDGSLFGPWPVNRFVRGLEGNSKLLQPNIRDGLLIHTGNWTSEAQPWRPTMTMPNSAGCLQGHPSEVRRIYETLVSIGVTVNENPFSGKDYPFKPQGIAVVELVDYPYQV